jgi:transcriptional regulator with XRE-family HTH domain
MIATSVPATLHAERSVGRIVRAWRQARGLSQLALAIDAGFSSRHISFIETGRTHPSREALLALAEVLDVPLRERNGLLEAAGFARMYAETPLASEQMAHVRGVLQFILDRHLPYAALVLDRHSTCLLGNGASGRLLSMLIQPPLLSEGANLLRVIFHPDGVRRWIVNWAEVERHLLDRAERELGAVTNDVVGAQLLAEVRGYVGSSTPGRPSSQLRATDLLLPIHIRTPDLELRLFSTIMTLGTPRDVTLQELRVETFFPADEASERCWTAMFVEKM